MRSEAKSGSSSTAFECAISILWLVVVGGSTEIVGVEATLWIVVGRDSEVPLKRGSSFLVSALFSLIGAAVSIEIEGVEKTVWFGVGRGSVVPLMRGSVSVTGAETVFSLIDAGRSMDGVGKTVWLIVGRTSEALSTEGSVVVAIVIMRVIVRRIPMSWCREV